MHTAGEGMTFAKAGGWTELAHHWVGGQTPARAPVGSVSYPQLVLIAWVIRDREPSTVFTECCFLCQAGETLGGADDVVSKTPEALASACMEEDAKLRH